MSNPFDFLKLGGGEADGGIVRADLVISKLSSPHGGGPNFYYSCFRHCLWLLTAPNMNAPPSATTTPGSLQHLSRSWTNWTNLALLISPQRTSANRVVGFHWSASCRKLSPLEAIVMITLRRPHVHLSFHFLILVFFLWFRMVRAR